MSKFPGLSKLIALAGVAAAAMISLGASASAQAALGPQADLCERNASAVLVHVEGLKTRSGIVRVQLYAANPKTFLEKGRYLERIEVPVPRSGAMHVCVAVPAPGNYALYVRHDANGNGSSDRSDGGGFSGNPSVNLTDLAFKRKPDIRKTQFSVDQSTREIRIVLNYVQGLSFKPVGA